LSQKRQLFRQNVRQKSFKNHNIGPWRRGSMAEQMSQEQKIIASNPAMMESF
jgi:hypothetical protein